MNDKLFNELLESIKENGEISRDERKPSKEFNFRNPNVREIRKRYRLS